MYKKDGQTMSSVTVERKPCLADNSCIEIITSDTGFVSV